MWDLVHIRTPFQVRKKVLSLMSVDLLRQQAKWKETLKEIRQIMTGVEQEGFTNLKVGLERTWKELCFLFVFFHKFVVPVVATICSGTCCSCGGGVWYFKPSSKRVFKKVE